MLNKMLRATLLKLKKVCFETFTPKIFRGDYYIPGKFEKLSATTLSRAYKSTKSGKGSQDEEEQCKQIIDEIFLERPTADPIKELTREQGEIKHETECETCNKLIAKAFGKDGDNKLPIDATLLATTAKQTEEQLAQKVETIDETPLVEAAKPKLEGFNVKPKVLGVEENLATAKLHFDKSEGRDKVPAAIINEETNRELNELCETIERGNRFYHAGKNLYQMPQFNPFENCSSLDTTQTGTTHINHPYDDIAKRCINIPPNRVDLYILKELERLGVPNPGGYGSKSNYIDNTNDTNQQNDKYVFQRAPFAYGPYGQDQNTPYGKERSMGHTPDKKNVHYLVQNLETKNNTVLNAEGEKTDLLHESEGTNAEHSEQTQSIGQTQPTYQDFHIKPFSESSRLPHFPINYCNENFTIHPSNREPHYSIDNYQDAAEQSNPINYHGNMVPYLPNYQPQEYNVSTPINYSDQVAQDENQNYWTNGYQYRNNYCENRLKSYEQYHQTIPENLPKANFSNKEQASLSTAAIHVFKNAETEKFGTPETVETVLPFKQNIIANHAQNISNEIKEPESQGEPKISQQLNFNEQSPAQHGPFSSSTAQEKMNVSYYSDPYDLRRPYEQSKNHETVEANLNQLDRKEQSIESQILISADANQTELDFRDRKQITEQLKVMSSENTDLRQLDHKEGPVKQAQIVRTVDVCQEQLVPNEEKPPIERIRMLRLEKEEPEPLNKDERPIQPKVLEYFDAQKDEIDSIKLSNEQPQVLCTSKVQQERLELKRQAAKHLRMYAAANDHIEPLLNERLIERTKVLTFIQPQGQLYSKEERTEHDSVTKQKAQVKKTADIDVPTRLEDPNEEFKRRLSSTILPLPRLNTDEDLPLSELLARLRERSKLEAFQELMIPLSKKCKPSGPAQPPCPPPAPQCPPKPPPSPPPCPPKPPACPKPSKPKCPSPSPCGPAKKTTPGCSKYIQVDADFDFATILREADIFIKKHMRDTITAILTKDVINQLEKMGVSLIITHPNKEIDVEDALDSNSVDLARDFEPWVPVPSHPMPRKIKKRPLVTPKEGCKVIPPPKLNPPCKQNPCIGFPKRTFSTPDHEIPDDIAVTFGS